MTALHDLIPPRDEGGTRFGHSFLASYWRCPTLWAWQNLLPHPDGEGHGIVPARTAAPLFVGGLFHVGLEEWYLSRCDKGEDTGEADLDRAIARLEQESQKRAGEVADEEDLHQQTELARSMLVRYHTHYNADGLTPEGHLRVMVDDHGPLVERELTVDLGWEGLLFTTKPDLVVWDHGAASLMDHKTCAASGFWARQRTADMDGQFSGELLGLRDSAPHLGTINGVVVNMVVKNPPTSKGAKTPSSGLGRFRTHRTAADLSKFRADVLVTLHEMNERVERYQYLTGKGHDPYTAIREVFPKVGMFTGACYAFGRECDYAAMCKATGHEHRAVLGFRPRHWEAVDSPEEES